MKKDKIKLKTGLIVLFILTCYCGKNPVSIEDEEMILFVRNSKNFSEICTIRPDGTDLIGLSFSKLERGSDVNVYQTARWAPDKSVIAVSAVPSNVMDYFPVWLMNNKGKLLNVLTSDFLNFSWT